MPHRILVSLGVDIFRDLRYDTWVLRVIRSRMEVNGWGGEQNGEDFSVRRYAVFPHYSFFNHSCDSNADSFDVEKESFLRLPVSLLRLKVSYLSLRLLLLRTRSASLTSPLTLLRVENTCLSLHLSLLGTCRGLNLRMLVRRLESAVKTIEEVEKVDLNFQIPPSLPVFPLESKIPNPRLWMFLPI